MGLLRHASILVKFFKKQQLTCKVGTMCHHFCWVYKGMILCGWILK